jgi:hypothetical protein
MFRQIKKVRIGRFCRVPAFVKKESRWPDLNRQHSDYHLESSAGIMYQPGCYAKLQSDALPG